MYISTVLAGKTDWGKVNWIVAGDLNYIDFSLANISEHNPANCPHGDHFGFNQGQANYKLMYLTLLTSIVENLKVQLVIHETECGGQNNFHPKVEAIELEGMVTS